MSVDATKSGQVDEARLQVSCQFVVRPPMMLIFPYLIIAEREFMYVRRSYSYYDGIDKCSLD